MQAGGIRYFCCNACMACLAARIHACQIPKWGMAGPALSAEFCMGAKSSNLVAWLGIKVSWTKDDTTNEKGQGHNDDYCQSSGNQTGGGQETKALIIHIVL